MKKNTMMRVAMMLLIAVLFTTSIVGGTFAKYSVREDSSDSATFAKFGVVVSVGDYYGMFRQRYSKDDSEYKQGMDSVIASSDSKLLAPGTKGSISVSVTGQPEVATRLTCNVSGETFQLPAGEYTLGKGHFENEDKTVTTYVPYEPIKFYFGKDSIDENTVYNLTMAELLTKIEKTFNKECIPNFDYTNEIGKYYIGWCWPFENDKVSNADFLDTYLGREAVYGRVQDISLAFDISVEQVD